MVICSRVLSRRDLLDFQSIMMAVMSIGASTSSMNQNVRRRARLDLRVPDQTMIFMADPSASP